MVTTFKQVKARKEAKFTEPTGKLAHNPTSFILDLVVDYAIKVIKKK